MLTPPLPYKEPRLVIPNHKAKDKRWYILYYVWDAQKECLTRKRDLTPNSIDDLNKRKAYCKSRISQLKQALQQGYHIDRSKISKTNKSSNGQISIKSAFNIALASRSNLRPKTQKNYKDYLSKFSAWLYSRVSGNYSINQITPDVVQLYAKWLAKKVSNRTFNNNITHNLTLFNYLVQEKVIDTNPFTGIQKLKTVTGKNIAYSSSQQKELLKFMEHKCPNLKLFCEFMYYTLARPNEICQLQVKHIDLYRKQHIYIPANISKNGHERHVVLVDELYNKLVPLKKLKPDTYIFGKGVIPNAEPIIARYVSDSYRNRVIKRLNYNKEYTLYSWKHTGVVNNYIAGISPAALRMQIGHTDTQSFEKYLKSLGLFENTEVMEKYVKLEY